MDSYELYEMAMAGFPLEELLEAAGITREEFEEAGKMTEEEQADYDEWYLNNVFWPGMEEV